MRKSIRDISNFQIMESFRIWYIK